MTKTRKKKAASKQVIGSRSSKKMFMPMDPDVSNQIAFGFRTALESVRSGYGNKEVISTLIQVTLLTGFLADAGLSLISRDRIDSAESRLAEILRRGKSTDNWMVEPSTITDLTDIVNEHDRQLRELRLQDIVGACDRLNRLIEKNAAHLCVGVNPGSEKITKTG